MVRSSGSVVGSASRRAANEPEPGDLADREAGRGGELGLLGRLERHVGEPLVGDERLGVRVAQDVGDLGSDQVVVDRHQVPAGLEGGEVELEHLDTVGQQGGDHVAVPEAELPQAVDDLVHPPEQLTRAVYSMPSGATEREVFGVLVRQCPESEIAHVIGPPLCRMVPVVLSWSPAVTPSGPSTEDRAVASLGAVSGPDRVAPDRRGTLEQVLVDGQPPVARGSRMAHVGRPAPAGISRPSGGRDRIPRRRSRFFNG